MPVAKDKYNLRPFKEAPLSTSPIKPIELEAVDLSLYKDGAENLPIRQKLATQIENLFQHMVLSWLQIMDFLMINWNFLNH